MPTATRQCRRAVGIASPGKPVSPVRVPETHGPTSPELTDVEFDQLVDALLDDIRRRAREREGLR